MLACDGQVSVLAVADGAWVRASGLGANLPAGHATCNHLLACASMLHPRVSERAGTWRHHPSSIECTQIIARPCQAQAPAWEQQGAAQTSLHAAQPGLDRTQRPHAQAPAHLEHARAEEEAGAAACGHCVDV